MRAELHMHILLEDRIERGILRAGLIAGAETTHLLLRSSIKARHPEGRKASPRSIQRASSPEGPYALILLKSTGIPSFRSPSGYQSAARSFQPGFIDSTSLSFFSLRQPLISFSRAIAASTLVNCSKYTSR